MFTAAYLNLKSSFPNSHFYLLSYYPKADRNIVLDSDITILPGTPFRLLFVTLPLSILYRCFSRLKIFHLLFSKDRVINAIEKVDLILDIGGITFSDGREIYLPFNIITVLPALILQKPVIKLAQAMGPFNGRINKVCARFILSRMTRIYARGKSTMTYLKQLGTTNAVMAADLAFSMPHYKIDDAKAKKYQITNNRKTIGIAPSSVVYKYCRSKSIDYVGIMTRFCDELMKRRQHNIILIPHSIRLNTDRLKNNDLPVIRKIADSMKSVERPVIISEELSSNEIRAVTMNCDYFFASRFHSMVSALSLEVPVMVCAWGHKYSEVLQQFGLESFAIDYNKLSLELLLSKFDLLIVNEAKIKTKIRETLPDVINQSNRYTSDIIGILIEPHEKHSQ